MSSKPCDEAIRELAYILWEMRGRPEGEPEIDWLRAEKELTEALNRGALSGFDHLFVNNTASIGQLRAFARTHCRS